MRAELFWKGSVQAEKGRSGGKGAGPSAGAGMVKPSSAPPSSLSQSTLSFREFLGLTFSAV